ncbi:MAG: CDP-alcohol phosphatidyltransferase family protein, partial [Phycisphaeraceae bacterium]
MLERRQIPNALTVLRLIMSVVFFALLSLAGTDPAALIASAVLFAAAASTDALDGYLARRWKVESAFGRVMDPLCDKVLVLGAFVYLAGPAFTAIAADGDATQLSGVYPWMVVIMLLREFLVTGLRGMVEAAGVAFGANWYGKAKMILHSIGAPILLL